MADILIPLSTFGQVSDFSIDTSAVVLIGKSEISMFYFLDKNPIGFQVFRRNDSNIDAIFSKGLSFKFSNTSWVVDNRMFTLLPANSLNSLYKADLTSVFFAESGFASVVQNCSSSTDLVFMLENSIYNAILKLASKDSIFHYSQLIFLNENQNFSHNQRVVIDIRNGFFYCLLHDKDQLKLFNAFDYADKNEFAFFSLGSIHNSGFDNQRLDLNLTGFLTSDSAVNQLLGKFVKNIHYPSLTLDTDFLNNNYHLIKYFSR